MKGKSSISPSSPSWQESGAFTEGQLSSRTLGSESVWGAKEALMSLIDPSRENLDHSLPKNQWNITNMTSEIKFGG